MTIKIEIPSDNKELARLVGEALAQYGGAPTEVVGDEPLTMNDVTESVKSALDDAVEKSQLAEQLPGDVQQTEITGTLSDDTQRDDLTQLAADGAQQQVTPEGVELDDDELPHDKRIHSDPPKLNADGTWKARRKPKDMERDEWEAYQEAVKGELKAALAGEPLPPKEEEETPPPPADDERAIEVEEITEAEENADNLTPPPPVENDVPPSDAGFGQDSTPTPPSADESELPERTFQQLMQLITGNNAKLARDGKTAITVVTELLNKHGVEKLPLLNSVRPDLIKVVYAELEALING